jgi:hypothetical protein
VLGLALAGCGAGRQAEVLGEHTSINGLNVNLEGGNIQVRNVFATPLDAGNQVAAGGTLLLHFHVYNRTDQTEVMAAAAPAVLTGQGVVAGALPVGPRNSVLVGAPNGEIIGTIANIPQPVWVGTYVPVTLSFANAGHIDMTVPVEDSGTAEF